MRRLEPLLLSPSLFVVLSFFWIYLVPTSLFPGLLLHLSSECEHAQYTMGNWGRLVITNGPGKAGSYKFEGWGNIKERKWYWLGQRDTLDPVQTRQKFHGINSVKSQIKDVLLFFSLQDCLCLKSHIPRLCALVTTYLSRYVRTSLFASLYAGNEGHKKNDVENDV